MTYWTKSVFVTSFVLIFKISLASAQTAEYGEVTEPTSDNTTDYEFEYVTDVYVMPEEVSAENVSMCTVNSTCVRKCCPDGQYLTLHNAVGCVPSKKEDPEFDLAFEFKDGRRTEPDNPAHILYGSDLDLYGNCSGYGPIAEHREYRLLSDGRLYTPHEEIYRNISYYCVDVIQRDEEHFGMWATTCYTEFQETPRTLFRYYSHSAGLLLSCVALAIIIACHVALPKLRDLSGMCLLSHVSSLLVADISLVAVTLDQGIPKNICIFLGVVIHSSFLATYMWLTVMCFDIWRYVRLSVKGIPCYLLQQQERRLFAYYSLAVWGSILLITCTTCTLHFLPRDAIPEYIIRPHFGVNRCFIIEEDANLLVYFFSILAVLCVLNVSFVGKTVHYLYDGGAKICCFQKGSSSSKESAVFNNRHLDVFWQRFQIFAMTIIIWTTEVLSWKIPPPELWDATDLLNTLQGVILLVIFLCSKRKRDMIQTRAQSFMGKAQTAARRFASHEDTSIITLESNLSQLNSDKETVDRIRKLSKQEETASSTIMKSLTEHKIIADPQGNVAHNADK